MLTLFTTPTEKNNFGYSSLAHYDRALRISVKEESWDKMMFQTTVHEIIKSSNRTINSYAKDCI